MIRLAKIEDLQRITDIYNQAILTQKCTADMETFTLDQRLSFFEAHQNNEYPLWVYQIEDQVVGYVYLSGYRPGRRAFSSTVEVSYYLDQTYLGKGIGSQCLEHAILEAKERGFQTMVAILLGINEKSTGLLKKFNFEEWGRLPGIAHFDDYITDHLYYGLKL